MLTPACIGAGFCSSETTQTLCAESSKKEKRTKKEKIGIHKLYGGFHNEQN
jgi:hypothetical protein